MNKQNDVRVAIVGCGRMGRRRAAGLMQARGARLEVVADTDGSRAASFAAEFNCRAAQDPNAAIADPGVDVVVIGTPNGTHAQLASIALESGKNVFVEKPMTVTSGEASHLVRLADKNDLLLGVGSNLRFFQNVQKARQILGEGKIGKPLFARGWVGNDGWDLSASPWAADPGKIGKGGTLLDNGCHFIDTTRWLFHREITEASGAAFHRYHNLADSIEDNFIGLLTLEDEIPVSFQCSWTDWWNGYYYFEVCGSDNRLVIDSRGDAAKCVLTSRSGVSEGFDYAGAPKDSFSREIRDFISKVADRSYEGNVASGRDGVRVIETIEALYQSARTGTKSPFLNVAKSANRMLAPQ